jgi:hypothetical protein
MGSLQKLPIPVAESSEGCQHTLTAVTNLTEACQKPLTFLPEGRFINIKMGNQSAKPMKKVILKVEKQNQCIILKLSEADLIKLYLSI